MKRALGLLFLIAMGSQGCAPPLSAGLRFVSLEEDGTKGKGEAKGDFIGKDCAVMVLGFGNSAALLTVESAIANGRKNKPFRYLNRMSIQRTHNSYVVWSKTCIIVKAKAFL